MIGAKAVVAFGKSAFRDVEASRRCRLGTAARGAAERLRPGHAFTLHSFIPAYGDPDLRPSRVHRSSGRGLAHRPHASRYGRRRLTTGDTPMVSPCQLSAVRMGKPPLLYGGPSRVDDGTRRPFPVIQCDVDTRAIRKSPKNTFTRRKDLPALHFPNPYGAPRPISGGIFTGRTAGWPHGSEAGSLAGQLVFRISKNL